MHCIIINSSDTFENRVKLIYKILIEQGFDVTVIASDYKHIEKQKRFNKEKDWIYINSIKYRKNISFKRLYSHYMFSYDAFQLIQDKKCDILYLVIPPNSQAAIAKKYLNIFPNTKVIMDIIDLWPESLPIKWTNIFPFTLWGRLRNINLKYANYVVTECDFYQEKLKKHLKAKPVKTIYWMQNLSLEQNNNKSLQLDNISWNLCYLGSINNIIDIKKIIELIGDMQKSRPVTLKIIGAGENKKKLIYEVRKIGAFVIDYGKVYDEKIKLSVFDSCHFGLNIMKSNVCIGMSMKSIEYINAGLPIINNVKGDLWNIIEKYGNGINYLNKLGDDLEEKSVRKEIYISEIDVNLAIKQLRDMFKHV